MQTRLSGMRHDCVISYVTLHLFAAARCRHLASINTDMYLYYLYWCLPVCA